MKIVLERFKYFVFNANRGFIEQKSGGSLSNILSLFHHFFNDGFSGIGIVLKPALIKTSASLSV